MTPASPPTPVATTPPTPSVADVNSRVSTINSMLPAGTAPLTPISVDTLKSNPTPMNLPAGTPPATQSVGLSAYLGTQADQFTKSLAADAASAQTARDSSFNDLISALDGNQGKAQLTDTADQAAGVDAAKSDLNDINNQILAEKVSTDHRIQALKENPNGLYGGALTDEIGRIQDESTARQADLAVTQLARQGKVELANTIASRAVDAKYESEQNRIQTLQTIFDENKANFTDEEQKAFQTAQTDRARQLDLNKSEELALYQKKIDSQYNGTGGTFTQSQLNNGAENAGTSLQDFGNLSPDDKNYFINGYSGFQAGLKGYQAGTYTEQQLRDAINKTTLSDRGKALLFQRAGISADAPASSGGFWSNAANFVGSIFNS